MEPVAEALRKFSRTSSFRLVQLVWFVIGRFVVDSKLSIDPSSSSFASSSLKSCSFLLSWSSYRRQPFVNLIYPNRKLVLLDRERHEPNLVQRSFFTLGRSTAGTRCSETSGRSINIDKRTSRFPAIVAAGKRSGMSTARVPGNESNSVFNPSRILQLSIDSCTRRFFVS